MGNNYDQFLMRFMLYPLTLEATKAASSLCLNALSSCNTSLKIDQKSFIQSNFNGSNIFGTIENCSRHG